MSSFDFKISPFDFVKVSECGNFYEVTALEKVSHSCNILKVSKDDYIKLETGELCQYDHSDSRLECIDSLKRSMKVARDRINTNCVDSSRLRWITLTYKENMRDPEVLYEDFKAFSKRMRLKFGDFEYITCAEPQERGAWHLHCIFIFPDVAPFLKNSVVAQLWGKGFVNVQSVSNVDNLGAYLSAYLTDVPLPDDSQEALAEGRIITKIVDGSPKRFIKGARLDMYPSGFHIFRYSRGIKTPIVRYMLYDDFLKNRNVSLTFQYSYQLMNDPESESDYTCACKKEYYKKIK